MQKYGFKGNVIGKTVKIDDHLRADQIDLWFKTNGKSRQWVVIDDTHYEDYNEFPEHIVRTKLENGLTERDVKKAIKIFNLKEDENRVHKTLS